MSSVAWKSSNALAWPALRLALLGLLVALLTSTSGAWGQTSAQPPPLQVNPGTANAVGYYTSTTSRLSPSTALKVDATTVVGWQLRVTSISANTTLTASDGPVIACTSGASNVTATLPAAATTPHGLVRLVKVDGGAGGCVLAPNGSDTLNGVNGTQVAPTTWSFVEAVRFSSTGWQTSLGKTTLNLATDVSGLLPTANGGLGWSDTTVSGSTHKLVTVSGSFVAGHCLQVDSTGNLVDAGGPCGAAAAPPDVSDVSVTTATNPASEAALKQLTLPSGTFNVANRTSHYVALGRYTTASGQTPTLRWRLYLCTVSGCGSGTVVTLADFTTAATTASVTNSWELETTIGTASTGATGTLESRTLLRTQIGAVGDLTPEQRMDQNNAVSASLDLTGPLFLRLTVLASTSNASNSVSQRLANLTVGPAPTGDIVSNLEASWHLDDNTGTTTSDSTGHGHTGTLSGSTIPTWSSSCRKNNCLAFNGSTAYVSVPHTSALDMTGDLTVGFWANVAVAGDGDDVVAKGDSSGTNVPFEIYIANSGTPRWSFYQHTSGGDFSSVLSFTSYAVPTSAWHHIVMTRVVATKTVTLYIDGTVVQALSYTTDGPAGSGAALLLGIHPSLNTAKAFQGSLDEVTVFARALSASDVSALTASTGP